MPTLLVDKTAGELTIRALLSTTATVYIGASEVTADFGLDPGDRYTCADSDFSAAYTIANSNTQFAGRDRRLPAAQPKRLNLIAAEVGQALARVGLF